MTDRLKLMWDQQREFVTLLQEKRNFPDIPVDISSKVGQKLLKDITHHIQDELFEASQHLKNHKSHRITDIPFVNRDEFIEELADSLHLFFELVMSAGVSLDEFYDSYMKKGELNVSRITNGY